MFVRRSAGVLLLGAVVSSIATSEPVAGGSWSASDQFSTPQMHIVPGGVTNVDLLLQTAPDAVVTQTHDALLVTLEVEMADAFALDVDLEGQMGALPTARITDSGTYTFSIPDPTEPPCGANVITGDCMFPVGLQLSTPAGNPRVRAHFDVSIEGVDAPIGAPYTIDLGPYPTGGFIPPVPAN